VKIIVPGNHDVPLYNVLARWLWPLDNYRRFITQDLEPFHADRQVGVIGINTARSLTWKSGRINQRQVEDSCARFSQLDKDAMRILVTHHPFDAADSSHEDDIVGRSRMAMEKFSECKVDLILTGHLHESSARESGYRYEGLGHSTLFIQAGTATSQRTRKSPNSWNLIRVDGKELQVICWVWDAARRSFAENRTDRFRRSDSGWQSLRAGA
jgi:3',5'-cyclic AMP phosphodiesterase CpdA